MIILFVFDTQEECDKFLYIYDHYLKTIYYTIKRFTNDEYMIEDLSQDVLIKIAENLSYVDLNIPKRTRNYVITITRNHCKNYLRTQDKIKEDSLEEWNENHQTAYSEPDDILNLIIEKDFKNHLINEIEQLNDTYQIVLELRYFLGFNNDEIAQFLNIKKKTVEMRLYRAHKILQEKLRKLKNEN